MNTGIYEIINNVNGKRYVGSTSDAFIRRWSKHKTALNSQTHPNSHLQNSWNLYGAQAFTFNVLERVTDLSHIIEREQWWIDNSCPEYNIAPVAGNTLGKTHTADTKRRMSEIAKKRDPQTRRKNDITKKRHAEATREQWKDQSIRQRMCSAISTALKGKPISQKTIDSHIKEWGNIKSPNGQIFEVRNLAEFCREHNLHGGAMHLLMTNRRTQHKGWTRA